MDKGAIISAAGDSAWATTSGFTVRNYPAISRNEAMLCPPPKLETPSERFQQAARGIVQLADTSGKQISAEEMKNLADITKGVSAAVDKAHAEGIHVAGERFVVTRIDEGNIYARQVGNFSPLAFPCTKCKTRAVH